MKIEWITTTAYPYAPDAATGGSHYDYLATKFLNENFNFELKWIKRDSFSNIYQRVLNEYQFVKRLSYLDLKGDVIIRTHFPVAFVPFKKMTKNIAIIHQFYKLPTFDCYYIPFFFKNLKKIDIVITVSKFWQNWFKNKGCKKVIVIYNPFNVEKFIFADKEIQEFKRKYNLPDDKPIVYLGTLGRGKGVEQAYQALKDLDLYLIASGRRQLNNYIPYLSLNHREFLCLLKCSIVAIQMSNILEGWCRVLHEAMLCKIPVIGSGRGGMAELLRGGGQIICKDFKELRSSVVKLLKNENLRKEMGERGYEFAKNFTYGRFKTAWIQLIEELR